MNAQEYNNNSDVNLMEEIVYNKSKSNIFSFSSNYSFNSALLNNEIFSGSGSSFMINSNSIGKNRSKVMIKVSNIF